jgi:hypothetical protein
MTKGATNIVVVYHCFTLFRLIALYVRKSKLKVLSRTAIVFS